MRGLFRSGGDDEVLIVESLLSDQIEFTAHFGKPAGLPNNRNRNELDSARQETRLMGKAWRPGTPGTFAVVIGVSDYATLDGSLESLNLGKLPVSASSAFRFFEWIENEYFVSGCPLAMCWLLLAPSKEELQIEPRMAQAALSPDFAGCDKAINAWFR